MLTKATARYHTQGHYTHMQIPISCWLGAKFIRYTVIATVTYRRYVDAFRLRTIAARL